MKGCMAVLIHGVNSSKLKKLGSESTFLSLISLNCQSRFRKEIQPEVVDSSYYIRLLVSLFQ